jgi:hypothetical protein
LISNHFGDSVGGAEKAGVGGSIPSLATINFNNLAAAKEHVRISRANNTRTSDLSHSLLASLVRNDFYFSHRNACPGHFTQPPEVAAAAFGQAQMNQRVFGPVNLED